MVQGRHYLKEEENLMWNRLGKGGTRYWGKRGAGTILTDGKVILLLKRGDKGDFPGYWSLPGGKVEDGETFLGGAQRETREETGHMPTCTRLASFDNQDGRFLFKSFLFRIDKPYVVKISDEHTDSKWVPLDEINNLKLHPKLREIMPVVLRNIREKIGNKDIKESVFHTGDMMRIGPFAIWEMQKYINKHSEALSEGWFSSKKTNLPPVTSLTPGTVHPQVIAYRSHVASELELPTPLTPPVEKALTAILSRVSPEPFGTGGTLRMDWFKTIVIAVYQNYIEECKKNGITPDPDDHRLMMARSPVQLLHAIRSVMPQERFHSHVTLEGGGDRSGAEHDAPFIASSTSFENELRKKFFSKIDAVSSEPTLDGQDPTNVVPTNKSVNPRPTGKSKPKSKPIDVDPAKSVSVRPDSGTPRKLKISGIPPEMMKIIESMPRSAWYQNNQLKSEHDLNKMLNYIHMLSGSQNYSYDVDTLRDLKKYIDSIS